MSQFTEPQHQPEPQPECQTAPEPSRLRRVLRVLARRTGEALLKAAAQTAVQAVLALVFEHHSH